MSNKHKSGGGNNTSTPNTSTAATTTGQLDGYAMDRYSRQIGAYGVEAMSRLITMRILICGLRGVGIETAKNLVLAGPGGVTVWDNEIVQNSDLGSNFFLTAKDVGQNTRGKASVSKLQELNRLVQVKCHEGTLSEDIVKQHSVMVCTKMPHALAVHWNNFCRANNIGFLYGDVHGTMGYSFVDLGDRFMAKDKTGEAPVTRIVHKISNDSKAILSLLPPHLGGKQHLLPEDENDGWISLDEVEGMPEINKGGPFRIHHVHVQEPDPKNPLKTRTWFDPYTLQLDVDSTKFGKYTGGGVMTQVKKPVAFKYYPLSEATDSPITQTITGKSSSSSSSKKVTNNNENLPGSVQNPYQPPEYLADSDGMKFGRAQQLHIALCGLWAFELEQKRLPKPNNDADANSVLQYAKYHNAAMQAAASTNNPMQEDGKDVIGNVRVLKPLFVDEVDETICRRVAIHAALELQPLCTFFGGILAQEVVKLTGKYSPLHQWLHHDAFEVLPGVESAQPVSTSSSSSSSTKDITTSQQVVPKIASTATILPLPPVLEKDLQPRGTRYDDLIQIIGYPAVLRLHKTKTFMVGCGALGCELLKNFALLGVGCENEGGLITVTDNDTIEVSNLSRQFLFRENNVGQAKSKAAVQAAIAMNPSLSAKALESLVAPSTEDKFDQSFWESLDFVTNALDNVKARIYVDGQCVLYRKPLLESGTLGTKCNVQVIIPSLTQSYSDGPQDGDAEGAIPMCTLRNFPSQIEHCIEWARAQFNDTFNTAAVEANNFLRDPNNWSQALVAKTSQGSAGQQNSSLAQEMGPLKNILELLKIVSIPKSNTFDQCVADAFLIFHRQFRDRINSLIKQYPVDAKDKEGRLFWSGTKRFPQAVVKYDPNDSLHIGYIISTANLLAVNRGLQPASVPLPENHPWRQASFVNDIVKKLPIPTPMAFSVDMSGGGEDDDHKKSSSKSAEDELKELRIEFDGILSALKQCAKNIDGMKKSNNNQNVVESCDFEKDQDWNFHIDYITASSNMRAWNYRLKLTDRHECKMIAGKIIPALATTTATVTGLVMIEMLKLIQGNKLLSAFRDSSNSLGVNAYFFSEPNEAAKAVDGYDPSEDAEVICYPKAFTKWEKTIINAGGKDITLKEFFILFSKELNGMECQNLCHDNCNIQGKQGYSKFIFETTAWKKELKDIYQSRLTKSLKSVIIEIYGEDVITKGSKYIILKSGQKDSKDQLYRVPDILFKF